MIDLRYPNGATPLDPDEAEGLLLSHITTREELDRWEQDNISEATAWLEKRKKKDILTQEFMKALHRRMFGNVWRWAGKFRQSDKNIGSPWWRIPEDLKNLCSDVRMWIESKTFPPDEIAVRFHHRLVQIHPFPNGNGRHARLMADLLTEEVLGKRRFSWGAADLTRRGNSRERYIEALKAADELDYGPLLAFARS
jgi:Fic-DOC domain mobile mystery protein B